MRLLRGYAPARIKIEEVRNGMLKKGAICCALFVLCSIAVEAAEKPARKPPPGRSETLACRLGTEDRHARIAVVVVKGKTDSFAYYSKWKPRTCSIYLQRNRDMYSKWADNGNITTVNLDRGAFLIEHKPGEYHFIFRDIDRERYCGMDGVINGSLIIKRGSEQCQLSGDIMVEGIPLGEANVARQEPEPAAGASDVASSAAKAGVSTPEVPEQKPVAAKIEAPAPPEQKPVAAKIEAPAPPEQKPMAAKIEAPAQTPEQPVVTAKPEAPPAAPQITPAAPQRQERAPAVSSAAAEKPAEPQSGNPISAFFRSLSTRPGPEQNP